MKLSNPAPTGSDFIRQFTHENKLMRFVGIYFALLSGCVGILNFASIFNIEFLLLSSIAALIFAGYFTPKLALAHKDCNSALLALVTSAEFTLLAGVLGVLLTLGIIG